MSMNAEIMSGNEPDWMVSRRANAIKRFNSLDAPTLKYGITMKIDLSDFNFKNFAEPEVPEQKIISTKEVIVLDFNEAVKKYPELMKEKFLNELTPPVNKFEAFHIANWKKTTVLIIPKNTELKEHIEINTFFQNTNVDNLLVIAQQNSSATIIDFVENKGDEKNKFFKCAKLRQRNIHILDKKSDNRKRCSNKLA